ncbi:hypothetical protein J2X76_006186 [Neorhizobium sp. 2083]|nr:hypothetical protein [Neorhizobium sp. 2083]
MKDALQKSAWFLALWLAGVGTVTIVGILIRSLLM